MTQATFNSTFTPPTGYPPSDFAPPGYYGAEPKTPHRGVLVLILGLVSISMCALTGPAAWLLANEDLHKMRYGDMDPQGHSMTMAGKVCGIIGTVIGAGQLAWIGYAAYVWMTLVP